MSAQNTFRPVIGNVNYFAKYNTNSTVGFSTNLQTIDFNLRQQDPYSLVTTGSSFKITIPETGVYELQVQLTTAGWAGAVSVYQQLGVTISGATTLYGPRWYPTNTGSTRRSPFFFTTLQLNANAFLQLFITNSASEVGAALGGAPTQDDSYFTIVKL